MHEKANKIKEEEQRNINYIENENFESLDIKLYSIKELENLLGSTDLYQRSFALRLLRTGLIGNSENLSDNDLFGIVLNQDFSRIIERLLQITSFA